MRRIGLLLATTLLAVTVASGQETFGLSPEDYDLFVAANEASAAFGSVQYTFNLDLSVDTGSGTPLTAILQGEGVSDGNNLSMILVGDAIIGENETTVDMEVRLIDGNLYLDGIDPSGSWIRLSEDDLNNVTNIVPDNLMDMITGQISTDEDTFSETHVSIMRAADSEGDANFVIEFDVQGFLASDAVVDMAASAIQDDADATDEEVLEQAETTAVLLGELMSGSALTISQFIDLETNLVNQTLLTAATGDQAPLDLLLAFDITLVEYGVNSDITTPTDILDE